MKDRLDFINGDGFDIIRSQADQDNVVFFIDPPYTASTKKAGSRLYKYHQIDHEELFRLASTLRGDFLMTYDDSQEVRALADQYEFMTRLTPMNNAHHTSMNELIIGRNLHWFI